MAAASAATGVSGGRPLTRRDVLTELPFGNRTVKLEVTGETIWAALENGVSDTENAGRPLPAGVRPLLGGRPA